MERKSWKNLIPADQFWGLIEESVLSTQDSQKQTIILRSKLIELSEEEMVGICYWNYYFLNQAINSDLWLAAYLAMGGCSDDSFYYFRCWLICRGQQVYDKALREPDSLLKEFCNASYRHEIQADSIKALLGEAVWQSDKIDLDAYIAQTYFEELTMGTEEQLTTGLQFDWQEEDPESMRKICPEIFDRFWHQPLIRYK